MSFGYWPVASFRKRAVYKTEFDIFKQSTDIDLISLISYQDDEAPVHVLKNKQICDRPNTVPDRLYVHTDRWSGNQRTNYGSKCSKTQPVRHIERREIYKTSSDFSRKTTNYKRQPESAYRPSNARTKCETDIYRDFAKTSRGFLKPRGSDVAEGERQCQSALDIHKAKPVQEYERTRSQTTCGFRPNERSRLLNGYLNKDKSQVNTKQKENTSKPIVSRNIVGTVNKAWRLRTAAITGQDTSVEFVNKHRHSIPERTHHNSSLSARGGHSTDQVLRKRDSVFSELTCSSSRERSCHISQKNNFAIIADSEINSKEYVQQHDSYFNDQPALVKGDCYVNFEESCELGDELRGSKDSGIGSNTVTPEFVNTLHVEVESVKDVERHVKFNEDALEQSTVNEIDFNIDSVSNVDISVSDDTSVAIDETNTADGYDVNDLINDLERFGNQSRLSVASVGLHSLLGGVEESNSLYCESTRNEIELESVVQPAIVEIIEDNVETVNPDLDDITMSNEARHAIKETLNDMGGKRNKQRNNDSFSTNMHHKGVNAMKRMNNNRDKYDQLIREKSRSVLKTQFKSLDSLGNEDESSRHSSPTNVKEFKECDGCSSIDGTRGKLFPAIRESTKLSKATMKSSRSTKKDKVYSLEQVKKKKYKIPGIGNYNLVISPESDFEITPPGFDSRYNHRPIISKEEQEIPPRFIRERSIQKCKRWLTNVSMSPMSLKPVKQKKKDLS